MRIGCLQFSPQVGDIENNLNRADAVLNKSQDVDDLDLLVLPELAFTGYNFQSLSHIAPYLEIAGAGLSALWARTTALKYNCNVVVGYPEKVDVTPKWPTSPEYYNSAIMISSDGDTIANYRKSFLYAVDEKWALEGQDGFFEGYIPRLGNVAMGICMDINPYKFESPWHAFEFAFHVLDVQANLVILTMAWLTREHPRSFTQLPYEPDLETLEYWVQRLEPIIRKEADEEIIVVFCNRTGSEDDAVYAGTSTVIGIKHGEVNLYGVLGRGVKELLVVDTSRQPVAKLARDIAADEPVTHSAKHPSRNAHPPPNQPLATTDHSKLSSGRPLLLDTSYGSEPAPEAKGKKARVATPITRDEGENWAFMSDTTSTSPVPSMMSTFNTELRSQFSLPKLGLHIPIDAHLQTGSQNLHNPTSASKQRGGRVDDISTPTAPSPTPSTLRPKVVLPDNSTSLSAPKRSIPPSVNMKSGASLVKVKRSDSPMTPPLKTSKENARRQTSMSEGPPSPPTEDSLHLSKPQSARPKKRAEASRPKQKAETLLAEAEKALQTAKDEAARVAHSQTVAHLDESSSDYPRNHNRLLDRIDTFSREPGQEHEFQSGQSSPLALYNRGFELNVEMEENKVTGGSSPHHHHHKEALSALSMDTRRDFDLALEAFMFPSSAPAPIRPPSTKSRNASLSRPQSATGLHEVRRSASQSQISTSFPFLASPSVLQSSEAARETQPSVLYFRPDSTVTNGTPGARTPSQNRASRSLTRADVLHKSMPNTARWMSQKGLSNAGTFADGNTGRPLSRPMSRGRQPITKTNPTNAPPGSAQAPQLIQRVARSANKARQASGSRNAGTGQRASTAPRTESAPRTRAHSATSSGLWMFGSPPPSTIPPNSIAPDDEIIAMISLIKGSCPVHNGSGSTPIQQNGSAAQHSHTQMTQESQQTRQQTRSRNPSQRPERSGTAQSQQKRSSSNTANTQPETAPEENIYEVILPPHIRDLMESLSNQDRRTQSPRMLDTSRHRQTPKFDPPTPTAMEFDKPEDNEPLIRLSAE